MANLDVATSSQEMFGGAAYVAAGLLGDGLFTKIGLVMRVAIKPMIFMQGLENEVGQVAKDSIFQSVKSGTVTLTMRRHNAEQMAALFPHVVTRFEPSTSQRGGYGYNVTPGPVVPIGLHIRPNLAYGVGQANDPLCWWIPGASAEEIGDFIYKVEDSKSSNEDFPLTFTFVRAEEDYTPGAPQAMHEAGRMLYQGDSTHIVTNTWERGLPFGFRKGYAGRPTNITIKAGTRAADAFTVAFQAPIAGEIASPITDYNVLYRVSGTTDVFTEAVTGGPAILEEAIDSLDSNTEYEVRVEALTAEGSGQQAVAFLRTS